MMLQLIHPCFPSNLEGIPDLNLWASNATPHWENFAGMFLGLTEHPLTGVFGPFSIGPLKTDVELKQFSWQMMILRDMTLNNL